MYPHLCVFNIPHLRDCRCVWRPVCKSWTARWAVKWGCSSDNCQIWHCADTGPPALTQSHRTRSETSGRMVQIVSEDTPHYPTAEREGKNWLWRAAMTHMQAQLSGIFPSLMWRIMMGQDMTQSLRTRSLNQLDKGHGRISLHMQYGRGRGHYSPWVVPRTKKETNRYHRLWKTLVVYILTQ